MPTPLHGRGPRVRRHDRPRDGRRHGRRGRMSSAWHARTSRPRRGPPWSRWRASSWPVPRRLLNCSLVLCRANRSTPRGQHGFTASSLCKPVVAPPELPRVDCSADIWRAGGMGYGGIECGRRSTSQRFNERRIRCGSPKEISAAQSSGRCPGRVQNRCRENLSFSEDYASAAKPVQCSLSVFGVRARIPASGESRKTAEGRTLRQKY
jgi:hypothetical protein